jgi:hypothetical protein
VLRSIQTRPAEAITHLGGPRAGVLSPAERATFARQAIRQMRVNVEAGNAWLNLAEVRTARRNAGHLDPAMRKDLEVLQQTAERRVLAEAAAAIHAAAKLDNWRDAIARAEEARPRLQGLAGQESSKEIAAGRAELAEALDEIVTVGRQVEALQQLQTGIKGYDLARPAEAAKALSGVNFAALPGKLEKPARALRSVAELRAAARGRWEKAPDVATLKQNVATFERGLGDATGADELGKRILQDLAVKAFLEGHVAEYKGLMPADGPPQHAANLLRDLKALALGEGSVATWPAESVLPAPEPGKGPPPGLRPLIPEGPAQGWRPPVRENAKADLPPLERAVEVAATIKARVENEAKTERARADTRATAARARLAGVQQRVLLPELPERRRWSEIEAALKRPLSPEERVRSGELAEQKKSTEQIVAVFRAQAAVNEDEAFLREVQKLRPRPLTAQEREQALRLRRAGRKAVEVAAALGP